MRPLLALGVDIKLAVEQVDGLLSADIFMLVRLVKPPGTDRENCRSSAGITAPKRSPEAVSDTSISELAVADFSPGSPENLSRPAFVRTTIFFSGSFCGESECFFRIPAFSLYGRRGAPVNRPAI